MDATGLDPLQVKSPTNRPNRRTLQFLDLPDEIHSQIASFLSIDELIPFLSLHPSLLSLTRSHLNPLPTLIRELLDEGYPYPPILAKLPSLSLFHPSDDGGQMFLPILVRARPRWIIERMELGRWSESVWKEAFERRFLPSWERYKGEGDTWRAIFLRILGRLEHRGQGCTHDESWTRFITLHRNGSASINRIYSRQFDPYQIFQELKHQNNLASEPTTVRVVVHLQDVRVIVLGVLYRYPSLFVNQNAHDFLHPPLLTEMAISEARTEEASPNLGNIENKDKSGDKKKVGNKNPSTTTNEIYYPLVRSLSPSEPHQTSYGLPDGPMPPIRPQTTARRSTLSNILSPTRTRQNSTPSESSKAGRLGAMLLPTKSRDGEEVTKPRKWLGRRHSGESKGGPVIPASALFGDKAFGYGSAYGYGLPSGSGAKVTASESENLSISDLNAVPGRSILSRTSITRPVETTAGPVAGDAAGRVSAESTRRDVIVPSSTENESSYPLLPIPVYVPPKRKHPLPYPLMRKPQPADSHRLYPNHTPSSLSAPSSIDGGPIVTSAQLMDRRLNHEVVEDDYAGNIWAYRTAAETVTPGDALDGEEAVEEWGSSIKDRYVEWDDELGTRKRWVGPMLVIAQLHPTHHPRAQPPGVDSISPTEGSDPDLGPKGMYASLGFEDLEKIMGWVKLKGGGAYVSDPRKGGMGF